MIGTSRRGRSRQDLPVTAEINVTSLVDVAFTLLVIFIITAPILQGGVEVSVPRGEVTAINQQDDPFIVSVDAAGTVYVGQTGMTAEEFEGAFPQMARVAVPAVVYLIIDEDAVYGSAYRVIAHVARVAREEGFRYALVGEQPPAEP